MKTELLYDAVDNECNVKMTVTPAGYAADCKMPALVSDCWNLFDNADQVKLSQGVLSSDGRVQLAPLQGCELKHENGLRTQETALNAAGSLIVSAITYDDNARLKATSSNVMQTENNFEAAGFPDAYRETVNGRTTEQKAIFNENNWLQEEATTDPVNGNSTRKVTEFFQQGLPKSEVLTDAKTGTTENRQNGYLRTNAWILNEVTATCAGSAPASAKLGHDANGTLNGKINSTDEITEGNVVSSVYVDTTHDGLSLNKTIVANGQLRNETNYLSSLNGRLLGGYNSDHTDPIHTPSGKAQVHFYKNPVTNDVYYDRDYKSIFDHQGTWNMKPNPNFDHEPPRFR